MNAERRHKRFFKFAVFVTKPYAKLKFNYRFEPVGKIDGPCFVLCNHNTDADPVLLGQAFGKDLYFVATEKVTRMGLTGPFLKHFFDPILHTKGSVGIKTTIAILKHIKSGHSVGLFPEGNRSFNGISCPIPPATGRLVRRCGATLVTYRLHGGYLSAPRWSKKTRKGELWGEPAGIYSPGELQKMTDDEVQTLIERDLYVDAYEDQRKKQIAYKGKDLADGFESAFFVCPKCGKIGSLKSAGCEVSCSCGFAATYDEYGYLNTGSGERLTLTKLDKMDRRAVAELYAKGGEDVIFKDKVTLEIVNKDHLVEESKEIFLSAGANGIHLGDEFIPMEEIEGVAINQKNLLILNVKGKENHYECTDEKNFCALKYLYLIREAVGSATGTL